MNEAIDSVKNSSIVRLLQKISFIFLMVPSLQKYSAIATFFCYKDPIFEASLLFFNSFFNKEVFPASNSTIKKSNIFIFGFTIPDELTLFQYPPFMFG
jgi:hypothetical protein